ncbi:hypothetical protein NE237_001032 [Protea cynaroides]|uniref:Uncharacterized protein n=1 Tax=Protea cynaroides TaxID=273540 RepID=A0A9Q0KSK1_9MAGN|nr:hypothetical protein NE237_001032 [Protea cynaroides]
MRESDSISHYQTLYIGDTTIINYNEVNKIFRRTSIDATHESLCQWSSNLSRKNPIKIQEMKGESLWLIIGISIGLIIGVLLAISALFCIRLNRGSRVSKGIQNKWLHHVAGRT